MDSYVLLLYIKAPSFLPEYSFNFAFAFSIVFLTPYYYSYYLLATKKPLSKEFPDLYENIADKRVKGYVAILLKEN